MAITSASGIDAAPRKQTLASNYVDFTSSATEGWAQQYLPDLMEKEAEIYRLKNIELTKVNDQLRDALDDVKKLQGLLPICANCKKIRDENGYWKQIEFYISDHSDAEFTHGICPDCMVELYGEDYVEEPE